MTVRVRKARRPGRLGCGHWVNTGHLIASHGNGWRCIECALAELRARTTTDVPASHDGQDQENAR